MKKGDIVLTLFPFTDLSGSKRRPALVLYAGKEDIILSFITSNIEHINEFDLVIYPNQFNKLKVASAIRVSKIATLHKSLIIGKVGDLQNDIQNQIDVLLQRLLKI
jgi:mRNA interferase MazF